MKGSTHHIILILLALLIYPATTVHALTDSHEELDYSVKYKWGLIDANMGVARVHTHAFPGGKRFRASVTGKSIDILGHIYEVSDTVVGSTMSKNASNVTHQHIYSVTGHFTISTITSHATGESKDGPVTEHLDNGKVIRSRTSDYASGITTGLLNVFYYMRQIDYSRYSPGENFTITLTTPSDVETISIEYLGEESISFNESVTSALHVKIRFTSSSSSKTDYLEVWLADDATHTPLIINGSLSVGHIECRLIGS